MKKFKNLSSIIILALILAISFSFLAKPDGGRVKVYLKNECSSDAKIKVASPGSSTHYTVADGEKKPFSFVEGTKVYNVDGKEVVEIKSSDEGKTYVICD